MATARRIRGAVIGLLAAGLACAPGCFGGGRGPIVITSNDPASKIPAIKNAVAARQTETVPLLVRSLESEDPAVRFYAIRGLQDLTGETFGYVWYAGERQRDPAITQWKSWLEGNGNGEGNDTAHGDDEKGLAGGGDLKQR